MAAALLTQFSLDMVRARVCARLTVMIAPFLDSKSMRTNLGVRPSKLLTVGGITRDTAWQTSTTDYRHGLIWVFWLELAELSSETAQRIVVGARVTFLGSR